MSLKEQLRQDLTAAMKSQDQSTTAALRMALAAIANAEVSGKQARQLTEDEVIAVLTREVKQREESAAAYRSGGREDSAREQESAAAVVRRYLPAALTEAELEGLVARAVAKVQAQGGTGGKAMGRVMAELKPAVAGRADGAVVAAAVKRALGIG